ncbi:uncharacterized protein LOC111902998 [Lactuca sativa]|uniref:uncharacterized protein LOC111902998 n=1 Tax=Lactuca sativa TaxID=4236 RepID=UPI001C693ABD|nr:uncharacterized protein LOC111902998 [Lactuca sativa]
MLLFGVCGHMIVLTAFPCQIDCFALDCLICASFDGYRHGGAYFCCKLSCAHCWTNGVWLLLTEQIRIVGVLSLVDDKIYEPGTTSNLRLRQPSLRREKKVSTTLHRIIKKTRTNVIRKTT